MERAVAAAGRLCRLVPHGASRARRAPDPRPWTRARALGADRAGAQHRDGGRHRLCAKRSGPARSRAHPRRARNLARFPFVSPRGTTAILREPIGVCGLITPWNWPLYQITAKVGPALAAGCTVVLKPSELSPLNALLFAEIMDEAGCPPGVFNLVNGTGPVVGDARYTPGGRHGLDHRLDAGGRSRRAGGGPHRQARCAGARRQVAQCRAAGCRSGRGVPLGVAAAMRNLGQSCSAPTRMLVPRATGRGRGSGQGSSKRIRGGRSRAEETTHGTIANRAQYDRIQAMIETGIAEGAKLVIGGPGRPEGPADRPLCAADDLLRRAP